MLLLIPAPSLPNSGTVITSSTVLTVITSSPYSPSSSPAPPYSSPDYVFALKNGAFQFSLGDLLSNGRSVTGVLDFVADSSTVITFLHLAIINPSMFELAMLKSSLEYLYVICYKNNKNAEVDVSNGEKHRVTVVSMETLSPSMALLLIELKKQSSCSVQLINKTDNHVAFKEFINLSGLSDCLESQQLILLPSCGLKDCQGSVLHGPLETATNDAVKICCVEDILIEGVIQQFVVHFHRARTVTVSLTGRVSTSRMGCTGGLSLDEGQFSVRFIYVLCDVELPCQLGSGGGNASTAGGGVLVIGSLEHQVFLLMDYLMLMEEWL
ncbi:hypothetical protein CTI12_AA001040 [Artemisia annua]|uniref:Uncharacterized protein n=1 Tax=Artemisia annua TaxID=35608 RepID=A0A2U1QMW9_ARTAN|nr:hypothetical protein CTI12_AA001040 [Artemisia annua]